MKNIVINVLIVIVLIATMITGYILFSKYYNNHLNEEEISNFIDNEFFTQENLNDETDTDNAIKRIEYKGYQVIGIIKIDKINLAYPILEVPNGKDQAMSVSIIKFYGNNLNDYGNVTLAGHNYYDSTMFAKIHQLEKEDVIEIIDNKRQTVKYKVYDKYNTSPMNTDCLETTDVNVKEITLITCTKGNVERLVVKAREIKE